jgi:hypothetical protein
MPLLLISGQPGAGKSTYCRWLEKEHGYTHVETDAEWSAWGRLLTTDLDEIGPARDVRNRLRQYGPNVALEWGFLREMMPRVRQLIMIGLEPWWFRADEKVAFQHYMCRSGPASAEAYQSQLEKIAGGLQEIEKVYRGRILNVLNADGTRMSAEEILAEMLTAMGRKGG